MRAPCSTRSVVETSVILFVIFKEKSYYYSFAIENALLQFQSDILKTIETSSMLKNDCLLGNKNPFPYEKLCGCNHLFWLLYFITDPGP